SDPVGRAVRRHPRPLVRDSRGGDRRRLPEPLQVLHEHYRFPGLRPGLWRNHRPGRSLGRSRRMSGSMATKVPTTDLRMGMFVAELDRPWTDTPFLLQGFLIDSADQIAELQKHCEFVIIDRARSVGKEFAAAADTPRAAPGAGTRTAKLPDASSAQAGKPKGNGADTAAGRAMRAAPGGGAARRVVRIEDIANRRDAHGAAPDESGDYPGILGRVLSGFKGMWGRERGPAPGGAAALAEVPSETPQEFAARAALLPAGIPVQTYLNQVSVEQEAPRARAIVKEASEL